MRGVHDEELMQVSLHHELEQHAHGLLPHADAQQTDDVGVAHLRHQLHLPAEVALDLGSCVLLEGLDGDSADAVVAIGS